MARERRGGPRERFAQRCQTRWGLRIFALESPSQPPRIPRNKNFSEAPCPWSAGLSDTRAYLEARAADGDEIAAKCLRFLDAPRSDGRPPKDDADALATIAALMRDGVDRLRAIAKVARAVGAGRRTRERWSRKLKKFS